MNQNDRENQDNREGQVDTGEPRESRESQGHGEDRESGEARPTPPEELKPWYYQYWFLYPTVVFWPLWSVLIIRSPWHNGVVSGALAWAYLIIGGGLAYVRITGGDIYVVLSTIALVAPGLLFTVVTQAHWIANRRRIMAGALHPPQPPSPAPQPAARRSRRTNRRRHRRRR